MSDNITVSNILFKVFQKKMFFNVTRNLLLFYIQCLDQCSDTMPFSEASIRSRICLKIYPRESRGLCFVLIFQQIRECMEAILKGTVSEQWSTDT